MTDNQSWVEAIISTLYVYDSKEDELSIIEVPDRGENVENIGSIVFLKDKAIIKKYDNDKETEYMTTLYAMDYDTLEMSPWLEDVPQDVGITAYDDYIIIDDADIQYFDYNNTKTCNIKIYDADANKVSSFEYDINNVGSFSGFGPDGISVDVTYNEEKWYVHEIKFEDVLNLNGDFVESEIVCEREIGDLSAM